MKKTIIGFHPTEVTDRLTEDTLSRRQKKESTTGSKKERREKAKEQKQSILSVWISAGIEG